MYIKVPFLTCSPILSVDREREKHLGAPDPVKYGCSPTLQHMGAAPPCTLQTKKEVGEWGLSFRTLYLQTKAMIPCYN